MTTGPDPDRLRRELEDAKLHLDELTRELDESLGAEEDGYRPLLATLERVRARIRELEEALEKDA